MALSRVKTWNAAETLTASDLNAEFNNICNHFGSLTNADIDSTASYVMGELVVGTGITSADGGQLHVHTATAGTIQAVADADEAVFENSGASGITILSGATSTGNIAFGDSGDADNGLIKYTHGSTPTLGVTVAATAVQSIAAAATTLAHDLEIYQDVNNADSAIKIGTSATEALFVEALNGGSNKTLEELRFTTKTASGTANHGKYALYVDEAHIADVDDSGINLASGKTFRINGTSVISGLGDFSGPGSSTDNAIVRFDGTGGKTGQTSSVLIDDSNNVSGIGTLSAGATTVTSLNASDGNITNVGNIALDTISSDAGTTVSVTLGTDAGDDFVVGNNNALVVEGDNDRIGIGTNSPDSQLHLKSASSDHPVVFLEDTNADANGPAVVFRKYGDSPADNDAVGEIEWQAYNDAGTPESFRVAQIQALTTDVSDGTEDGAILFKTMVAGTFAERWRMDYSGQLTPNNGGLGDISYININTSTNAYAQPKVIFASNTSSSASTNGEIRIHQEQSAHANYRAYVYTQSSSNTQVFRVMGDGDVENANNSYGSTSDLKLKQDITEARSYWDNFKALQFKKFRFKKDVAEDENAGYRFGLIAQDVESIFPSLVKDNTDLDLDGTPTDTVTKSIKYSVLSQIGLRVVQELQTRLEAAEAKIAALESA